MSFRATVEVVYAEKRAWIGFYRNWDEMSLLFEAHAAALVAQRCADADVFRRFIQGLIYRGEEIPDDSETDETVRIYEEISEYPVTVDVLRGRIYLRGYWPCAEKRKQEDTQRTFAQTDVTALLCGEGIRYSERTLEMFRKELMSGNGADRKISRLMNEAVGILYADKEAGTMERAAAAEV